MQHRFFSRHIVAIRAVIAPDSGFEVFMANGDRRDLTINIPIAADFMHVMGSRERRAAIGGHYSTFFINPLHTTYLSSEEGSKLAVVHTTIREFQVYIRLVDSAGDECTLDEMYELFLDV